MSKTERQEPGPARTEEGNAPDIEGEVDRDENGRHDSWMDLFPVAQDGGEDVDLEADKGGLLRTTGLSAVVLLARAFERTKIA